MDELKALLASLQKQLSETSGKITAMSEEQKGAEEGKLAEGRVRELEQTITILSEKIKALDDAEKNKNDKDKDKDKDGETEVEKQLKQTQTELADYKEKLGKADTTVAALDERVKGLEGDNKDQKVQILSERVKNQAVSLKEKGFWPATIDMFKQIALSEGKLDGSHVIKLSEKEKDKDDKEVIVEKDYGILDTMIKVLDTIPEDVRVDLSERVIAKANDQDPNLVIDPETIKRAREMKFGKDKE